MHELERAQTTIAVLGLGYVGCVSAACLAKLGHRVIGVDRDSRKVESVLLGRAPFYEPGLEAILSETVSLGLLSADTSLEACIESCDIVLICVGTPSAANGNLSTTQLRRACDEIAASIPTDKRLIVVVRSTVFPGTCDQLLAAEFRNHSNVSIVSNPEFLREGSAVQDFLDPGLIVIGAHEAAAATRVSNLYELLDTKPMLVALRAAEMIKYACNAFHAVKVCFSNEIGALCARQDISPDEVMDIVRADTRLNVSTAYLKPGFAFGGSCLPKDLRALNYRARRLDVSLPMLGHVLASNDAHLQRAIDAVLSLDTSNIGIFGLAFKENTDDLRESPVITLIEHLIGKGRALHVYDPHIKIDDIYGQNRAFALEAVPHIGKLNVTTLDELLKVSDHIVLAQKPTTESWIKIAESGKFALNLTDLSWFREGSASGKGSDEQSKSGLERLAKNVSGNPVCDFSHSSLKG